MTARRRRRGKEWRERAVAILLLVPTAPVFAACAAAIKAEGLVDTAARGPVFWREDRIARGRVIQLLKFRTLTAAALASLPSGPTHIAVLEKQNQLTRRAGSIRRWYLDELPQLLNIAKGDMFLIGTRPYPVELYENELAKGITRKRDMPAGLVGPVQSRKGRPLDPLELDADYWELFQHASAWQLLVEDVRILWRSAQVLLEHKGI